jgi:hypothetical protein
MKPLDRRFRSVAARCLLAFVGSFICGLAKTEGSEVTLLKTPNSGIQPQAVVDSKGVVHLIYFKGKPEAGDLFYIRAKAGQDDFSEPIPVNSQSGSAVAAGTIRGAQLAIGRDDRVHVAWNGSSAAEPRGPGGTPMLYARSNAKGTAFEPQRNLITWAGGIDGGGAIAADRKGNVYVAWHATAGGKEESERAVYVTRSTNNGMTFEREKRANSKPSGACGCCGMRAFIDSKGFLYILYRAAGENTNRDMTLLVSRDKAATFESGTLHKWYVGMCPMSSESLAEGGNQILAAWETDSQVYYAGIEPGTTQFSRLVSAPGSGKNRKHPFVVANAKGQLLFAWTEGTGWAKGGALVWQVYDKNRQPTAEKGRIEGVPTWSLLSGLVRPDGSFELVY